MDWSHIPKSILLTHLSGARGGHATVNLLLGKKNPSGKLNETYANNLEDYPSFKFYPGDRNHLEYRESIFVGYRYFDTAQKEVKYPFGFGLSYTTFEYNNMKVKNNNNLVEVHVTITNTGNFEGKEVVQLYISCLNSKLFRAKQELKRFKKINLMPGESKEVVFSLDEDCFSYFNTYTHKFEMEKGIYSINVGSSSRDIKFSTIIKKNSTNEKIPAYKEISPSYYELYKKEFNPTIKEFEAIYGNNLPITKNQTSPFNANSTINDIKHAYGGDLIISLINKKAYKFAKGDRYMQITIKESLNDLPFRLMTMATRGVISHKTITGFINLLNKHYIKGLLEILRGTKHI